MKIKYILTLVAASTALVFPSADQAINKRLAWAYQAKANSLSKHDTLILLKWGKYGQEWNLGSAPIVRDFLDQSVSAESFLKTSSTQLRKLTSIVYKMDTDAFRIEDAGVRNTISSMVSHHKKGLKIYNELHRAVMTNNSDLQLILSKKLSKWGQKKQNIFLPTYRRLSKILPDNIIDKTMSRLQNEVSSVLKGE
jgi:hypothetical protein